MYQLLQIVATTLVAVAMTTAVAHALEFPGKLRLSKEEYLAVQPIYYPGFTIAGVSEVLGLLALLLLAFLSRGMSEFPYVLVALVAMAIMVAIYWLITHPVNSFWLKSTELSGAGSTFFSTASSAKSGDWTAMRDRWEYSHVARAIASFLAFLVLTIAWIVS